MIIISLSNSFIFVLGRVAQLVEQLTFNQWVTGSNPVALTILYGSKPLKALAFGGLLFCLGAKLMPKKPINGRQTTYQTIQNPDLSYQSLSLTIQSQNKNKDDLEK